MASSWVRHFVRQPADEAWQQNGLYRLASGILSFQHLLVMACGLAWLIAPSGTIDRSLSLWWSGFWSALFVVFSFTALAARLWRAWPIEAAANIVVAISVWLWAMVILFTTPDYSGLQTALMLLGFAASLWGWSLTQIAWVQRRESETARLQRKVSELLADERTRQGL